ncbi:MAG: hypothetical protein WCV83_02845 [Candidatus Magasanikbacteria bacterium]|jgi:hypothetical protein
MERKPWILSRFTNLFDDGRGRRIIEAVFRKNNGVPITYTLIAQSNWSTGLAMTTDGKIIKVREPKPGRGSATDNFYGWELPAAALKTSEGNTPEELFAKAIENETGYRAGRIVQIGPDEPMLMASRTSPTSVRLFVALDCVKVGEPKEKPEDEEIEVELVSMVEWVNECLLHPTVNDWSAVCATVFGLIHLGWTIQPPVPQMGDGPVDPRD